MSKGGAQQAAADLTEGKPAKSKEGGGSGFKGLFSRFSGGSKSANVGGHKYSPADSTAMGNGSSRHGSGHSNAPGSQDPPGAPLNGANHSPSGQSFNSLSLPGANRLKIGDRLMDAAEVAQLIPQLEEKLKLRDAAIEEKDSMIRKQKSVVDEQFQKIQALEEEIIVLKAEFDRLQSVFASQSSVPPTSLTLVTPQSVDRASPTSPPQEESKLLGVGGYADLSISPRSPTPRNISTVGPTKTSGEMLAALNITKEKGKFAKKQGVSAEPDIYMTDKIKLVRHKKSANVKQTIRDAILHNDFLKHLDSEQVLEVVECMYERQVPAGSFIIREGEAGAHLYIASEGEMEVSKEGKTLGKMGPGKVFGELAILYNCERTASVKAITNAKLWVLDRGIYQLITQRLGLQRHETLMQFIHQVPLLRGLPEERLSKIADSLEQDFYSEGTFIVREGERGDAFFIIIQGEVKITQLVAGQDEPVEVRKLHKGDYFGEKALLGEEVRTASAVALEKGVEVLTLDRESFEKLIGDIQELKSKDYRDEERGAKSAVEKRRSGKDSGYDSGGLVLGTEAIPTTSDTDSSSVTPAQSKLLPTICHVERPAEIRFERQKLPLPTPLSPPPLSPNTPEVDEIVTPTYDSLEGTSQRPQAVLNPQTIVPPDVLPAAKLGYDKEFEQVEISHLKTIATLGVGGFGRVELVALANDKSRAYALKAMKKKHIIDTRQQEHIFSERNIMLELRSPFIVRLYKTFRDKKFVYMLLEACLGGELWTILRDRGHFDDMWARFYAACVVEALEYLHKRGIVYRDLKPENCLVDGTGYLKLVDFGFAKKLGGGRKTWTFCGTPEYVAPEIILNKGHDHSADFWAFGIYISELLLGRPPFQAQDPMKTYTLILKGVDNLEIPNRRIGKTATVLVKKLCRDNPAERLGCQSGGIEDIRKQRWFVGFDWDALRARTLKPPFVPKVTNPCDVSNFDQYPPDHDVPPDETSGWDEGF